MSFRNRTEAGRALARALAQFAGEPCVILALPRGGVPVAAEVARALNAPLDLVLVRKIGVPEQPELAMGAVADGGDLLVVRNEDVIREAAISETAFKTVCDSEVAEIARRREKYLQGRNPVEVAGRIAILVDDGIATGATTRAALHSVRKRNPKKLILAVPVAPADTITSLRSEADEIVCLESHVFFGAIGFFYADFRQVSDEEVIGYLREFQRAERPISADVPSTSAPPGERQSVIAGGNNMTAKAQ